MGHLIWHYFDVLLGKVHTHIVMTFQNIENDDEPVRLTEEVRAEITEEGQIDSNVRNLEPEAPVVEPEDEAHFEETTDVETQRAQERKLPPEKTRKAKRKRQDSVESRSLSKLHTELRKHSDARKKTDLAVKDIEKKLKGLLLAHHSAIKDLQKQVAQMRRKFATIESRKSGIKPKAKKKARSKKSKKKTSQKNIKKR